MDFFVESREFFGFLVDFEKKIGFWLILRENFKCFLVDFERFFGFLVHLLSFKNNTVAPSNMIRLHLNKKTKFYLLSDYEYGGPCHVSAILAPPMPVAPTRGTRESNPPLTNKRYG